MTNAELNTALYQKMFAEQQTYREWLMSLPPKEILEHGYEFVIREDILLSIEENDLSDKQAKALLKSPIPLADVFKKFGKWETGHMKDIWDSVECRANEVMRAEFIASRREGR